jgi:nucleoside-diphosphate-sugar epimerase
MRRDFTYIDDIVSGTVRAIERPVPYDVFNLGNSDSIGLMDFIRVIEEERGTGGLFSFRCTISGSRYRHRNIR